MREFPIIYTIKRKREESRNLFKYVYNLSHIAVRPGDREREL